MTPRLRSTATLLALALLVETSAAQSNTPAQITAASRDSLTITFLANEGVMLSSAGASVLIDALYGGGLRGYGAVSAPTRASLESARPPFDRVTVVLATHLHGDHFNAEPVFRHLKSNPVATFISSPQAVSLVRAVDTAATRGMATRLVGVNPPSGQRQHVVTLGGVTVYALGLPHGRDLSRVPVNVGYVIEIGGRRVLHVGDSQTELADFASLRLTDLGIDVALLPTWYFQSARMRDAIRRDIRPKEIGLIHAPAAGLEGVWDRLSGRAAAELREIRTEFPNAHAFARELEHWVIR